MDLLTTDLGLFTPMVKGHALGNMFSSNPSYDEAFGPPKDDRFIPIEEFDCGEWTEEEEAEYWERLMSQDPNEPLGPGETRASVLEDARYDGVYIVAEPGYQANLGPAKRSLRLFTSADTLPAVDEVAVVSLRKFDRKTKRWMKIEEHVPVIVRRRRVVITVH